MDDHKGAVQTLYQKLIDTVLADEGAGDPNVAMSALAHALLETARAAGCPLKVMLSILTAMERAQVADAASDVSDPDVSPSFGGAKPHDC